MIVEAVKIIGGLTGSCYKYPYFFLW